MIETLVWCLIGWMIGSFLVRNVMRSDERPDRIPADQLPPGTPLRMTIHMEEIKGWWYGWFHNDNGTEVFISQGETYDVALNNCKSRVNEKNPDVKVDITFEMKNASPTVQN